MKRILILLLTVSLISCSKDEIENTPPPDYSSFLNNHIPSLTGKLNSQYINWNSNQCQMSLGVSNVYEVTNPERILLFGLSPDESNRFTFITPKMDTSNPNDTKNVLSGGQKQFGDVFDNFQFSMIKDDILYINNPNSIQNFEILKTEEFTTFDNEKHMLVWIKIDNLELENSYQSNEKIQLENVLMIAELNGFIFE